MEEHKHRFKPWKVTLPSNFDEFHVVIFYYCEVEYCEVNESDLVEVQDL